MDRMGLDINPQVDMNINGGVTDLYNYLKDYTTVVLQPNRVGNRNILTQEMVAGENIKYVIKYNYNLDGKNVVFNANTILEIDGGSLTNGGIVGNNTLLINTNELPEEDILINIVKSGTWRASIAERMDNFGADEEDLTKVNDKIMLKDKEYEPLENSGLGRVYLRKNLVKVYSPWMYIPVGNKVYLLYSKNNVIYAVYDSSTETGLGLKNNLVYEMEDYNLSDISAIVGDHILGYTAAGGVYTITLPDNTTITSTELNNTEILRYKEGGNIERNLLTQKMLNKANTIYHIQYDYVLGANIAVPANCVLEFDGGSISGAYTLTFANTQIGGNPKFDCELSGTIANGFFNPLWLMDSDFGVKINKASQYFYNIYVPPVDITYNTPIYIHTGNESYINIEASLTYSGNPTNNDAALTIDDGKAGTINIRSLVMDDFANKLQWNINRTINFIGIKFLNCLNCHINVNYVQGFNECIRFHAIGEACAANMVTYGTIRDFNFAIRLYQENSATRAGWVNENHFLGGGEIRSLVLSSVLEEKYAFYVAGPNADPISYKDSNATDTLTVCSCIVIHDTTFENIPYPIFSEKGVDFIIDSVREEAVTGLFKIKGEVFGLSNYVPEHTNVLFGSNVDDCGRISRFPMELLNDNKEIEYVRDVDGVQPYGQFVLYDLDNKVIKFTGTLDKYHGSIGVIVSRQAFIHFNINGAADNSNVRVVYLDSNYNNITPQINSSHPNNTSYIGWMYDSTKQSLRTLNGNVDRTIAVPSDVSYVFIGIDGYSAPLNTPVTLFIDSNNVTLYGTPIPTMGTTADRPTGYLPKYITYFDKTICKYIHRNDNDNWVDFAGNAV